MHDPNLKLNMCVKNIVIQGTVSQIFDRTGFFVFLNLEKKNSIKKRESYPFFDIKQKLRLKSEI